MSDWVYRGKAAKFWGMNPYDLARHPYRDELCAQAWDLMAIDNKTEYLAHKLAEIEARKIVKKPETDVEILASQMKK